MQWLEIRCQREREGTGGVCNNQLGFTALRDGHVFFWCRKCKRWVLFSSASFMPPTPMPDTVRGGKGEGETE